MQHLTKPLLRLFEKKPYLAWWISDKNSIGTGTAVFTILNYGDFDDVRLLLREIGVKKTKNIFEKQLKGRNNYEKKVVYFFKKYFKKHA